MIIRRSLLILASVFHISWIIGKPLSENEANGANEVTIDSGSTSESLLPVSITLEKTFAEDSGEASGFDASSASGAGKRDSAVGQNNIPGFSSKQKEEETIEEVVEDTPEENAQTEEESSAENNVEPISQNAEPNSFNAEPNTPVLDANLQITEENSQKPIELNTEKSQVTSGESSEYYAASHANNPDESGVADINEKAIGSGEDDASSRQNSEENQEEEMVERREPDEEERVEQTETSNDEAVTKGYEELQDAKRNVITDASNDDKSRSTFKQKRNLEEDVVISQRYPYMIQPVAPSYDLMAQANDVVEVDEGDE